MRRLLPCFLVALLLPACTTASEGGCGTQADECAALVGAGLPRELAPGIRAQSASAAGDAVVIDLLVAADLRLPDGAGFAAFACADPRLAAHVAAGGSVRFSLMARDIATVTSCPGVN